MTFYDITRKSNVADICKFDIQFYYPLMRVKLKLKSNKTIDSWKRRQYDTQDMHSAEATGTSSLYLYVIMRLIMFFFSLTK